jgi:hypothetical protein
MASECWWEENGDNGNERWGPHIFFDTPDRSIEMRKSQRKSTRLMLSINYVRTNCKDLNRKYFH